MLDRRILLYERPIPRAQASSARRPVPIRDAE